METWTTHALQRADQRFPNLDLVAALRCARPAGPRTKARIRENCPKSARRWMRGFRGRYYLISGEVVFVMERGVVITVFRLRHQPSTALEQWSPR
ncbi:MAG: hypothetical protein Q8K89_04865 [Actinomycetota bacterium]|nr:hypothetical protein [Actinomycetota bacterium]